mmetsp:Transcript_11453/g.10114  ORF Transcript_11453/g.10114 Transcript_11453/m.10114 type:complete len:146 (-) Transcript_11453:25-462(-)
MHHKRLFNKNHFKSQRPDLDGVEKEQWQRDFRDGQAYLRAMLYMNKLEMRRMWRAMGSNSYSYIYNIMDDYLKQHRVDSPRIGRMWTWKDSTKIADFFKEHKARTDKYGLNNRINGYEVTKESLKEKEDELTEYFLHEMRKKPVA